MAATGLPSYPCAKIHHISRNGLQASLGLLVLLRDQLRTIDAPVEVNNTVDRIEDQIKEIGGAVDRCKKT